MGDPRGIGPEIIAKLYRDHAQEMRGTVVVGDAAVFQRASVCIGADRLGGLPVALLDDLDEVHSLPVRVLPVLQIKELKSAVNVGQSANSSVFFSEPEAGDISAACVRWATSAALSGKLQSVVTAPICKAAWAAAQVPHPGHTELLQAMVATHLQLALDRVPVRMMLANHELRTILVSIHVSLAQAIAAVTFDNVLQTIRIAHAALTPVLGRPPHLAVAGLNPHAGEGGLMGMEETTTIGPAVAAACDLGMRVTGPLAPDTVFMRARTGEFDAVIAMYHDQGLIPVKYLGLEQGVNVSLGLPLVRTSPDHGTAFDIAWKNKADASSLLAAVRMARSLRVI